MKKTKDNIIFMIILMSMILITPTISQAALQSNGNTPARYKLDDWIWSVREMQQAGGTLGLTDTIEYENEEKYLTSNNPNLDIHMQKNTEYGAMAILSASSYGNPNPIGEDGSTTGNNTGVYMNMLSSNNNIGELVVAGNTEGATNCIMAVQRYKNNYTSDYVAKMGDAIEETYGWHSPYSDSRWMNRSNNILLRNRSAMGIFQYNGSSYLVGAVTYTRAVIVVGSGV